MVREPDRVGAAALSRGTVWVSYGRGRLKMTSAGRARLHQADACEQLEKRPEGVT